MKQFLQILAFSGLILTLIPSILFFMDLIDLQMNKNLMLLGAVLWLGITPVLQRFRTL